MKKTDYENEIAELNETLADLEAIAAKAKTQKEKLSAISKAEDVRTVIAELDRQAAYSHLARNIPDGQRMVVRNFPRKCDTDHYLSQFIKGVTIDGEKVVDPVAYDLDEGWVDVWNPDYLKAYEDAERYHRLIGTVEVETYISQHDLEHMPAKGKSELADAVSGHAFFFEDEPKAATKPATIKGLFQRRIASIAPLKAHIASFDAKTKATYYLMLLGLLFAGAVAALTAPTFLVQVAAGMGFYALFKATVTVIGGQGAS